MIRVYFIISLTIMLVSCGNKSKQNTSLKKQPNVIIVLTDDQGYGDLAYHGNPIIKTPNIDAFAAEYLELTNFHVGTTCTPTRAGIMTGRNANRNNTWHTIAGCSILLEDEETIAQIFQKNGYKTSMIGKWHLGDNYPFRPQDRGFNNAFYHGGGGVQQTPDYWNNDYFDDTYFRKGTPEKTKGYCTDVWFNDAINQINSANNKPFFLYLALNAAHGPFNVPEAYAKMYKNDSLIPAQKRFYGMITNIDDNFGKLVKHLKQTKQFNNTILIFTTDNGTAVGIHHLTKEGKKLGYNAGLRGTKGSHYDGGHRVPFFMSWPNGKILAKTSINQLIAHVDLLPTLADLSGIEFQPKKPLDGASMSKILTGEIAKIDRMLAVDTQRNQLPEKGKNSAVMSNNWRLVNGKELYNFHEDPGQKNNISEQHPEIVSKMQHFYNEWWTSIEPEIRHAEIPIGDNNANPTTITVHDMHTVENIPWNQVQIRERLHIPKGYYSIKVVEEGEYKFKLYRYPPEMGFTISNNITTISGTNYKDELPLGVGFNSTEGQIEIGNALYSGELSLDKTHVTVQCQLTKGSYILKSNFITHTKSFIPAYYTVVTKL